MILKDTFAFLNELKSNNDKEWFDANKNRYETVRENLLENVGVLIKEIGSFDSDIFWLEPNQCVFRINRDVRFSANKNPYKTNLSAGFSKGGKKSGNAFYYMEIAPENSSLNGGIWMPEASVAKKIRQAIYDDSNEFVKIITDKKFVTEFGEFDQAEKLKNVPRGFDKDFAHAELLKLKSFTVTKTFKDSDFANEDFIKTAKNTFEKMFPLVQFLNKAVA